MQRYSESEPDDSKADEDAAEDADGSPRTSAKVYVVSRMNGLKVAFASPHV